MIDSLRHLLTRHFWLKFFSLLLAVLIWLTISFAIRNEGTQDLGLLFNQPARVIRVPVLVMSAAFDLRNCRIKPDHVEVTLRGPSRNLDALQPHDIRAVVDLTDIQSAHAMRKRIDVSTPPGVTYVSAYPLDVEVFLSTDSTDHTPPDVFPPPSLIQ